MSAPLTIRNLTAQPLTLKLTERYEAPNSRTFPPNGGVGSISNLTSNFTTLFSNGTSSKPPSQAQLVEKAPNFTKEDVDVRLEPFTTHKTVKATERSASEIIRLTFQGDGGGRWRIDTPTPSSASQVLTPLTPEPKHEYSAIYLPSSSFLALYESTDLQCWMREFADTTPLSALSIPGTHNSPTHHRALPSVRCQAVPVKDQLANGVRFLDIRVQPTNPADSKDETLNLVHGAFPISVTGPKKFRPFLTEVQDFLRQNPSETIILSLKREGTGNATDHQLSTIIRDHYITTDKDQWYTSPTIPDLSQCRGKIVLIRRFGLDPSFNGQPFGINAENWADNTPNCLHESICVQDFYEVLETENIDKKIRYCCDHFERAAAAVNPIPGVNTDAQNPVPPGPLYLNFLSASNFWKVGCWPEKIAEKLNPAITEFLCEKHEVGDKGVEAPGQDFNGDGGVGVVVCDWVGNDGDWDLVKCIVGMNSRLLLRQRGRGWR